MHAYLGGILRQQGGTVIVIGGTADHVHLLFGYKPAHSMATLVRELKSSSSLWAKRSEPHFTWQEGYRVFSVSQERVSALVRYIENQEAHHRSFSSEDELRQLLEDHRVEFVERFFA